MHNLNTNIRKSRMCQKLSTLIGQKSPARLEMSNHNALIIIMNLDSGKNALKKIASKWHALLILSIFFYKNGPFPASFSLF